MPFESQTMLVRSATSSDLLAVARIHKSQFSTHFLGQYSKGLLARFYEAFLGRSVFLVHESNQCVNGFVLGGDKHQLQACKTLFIRSNLIRCVWETVLRPRTWPRCISHLRMVSMMAPDFSGESTSSAGPGSFSLLSIAVSREAVGTGVAKALVAAFERELSSKTAEYYLSVDKRNSRALAFYFKLGFQQTAESGQSLVLRRSLPVSLI